MQRDQRVLELGRCLADDRFAVTVDTVDIIAADILRRVAHRAARGRTTVNPLFNLARAVQLLIQAFGPQEAATRIRLECGAIISVRERVAHVIAFPRSEEHTSALQSLMRISYAVFCLTNKKNNSTYT